MRVAIKGKTIPITVRIITSQVGGSIRAVINGKLSQIALATGGIIQPVSGGVMARIAEAGIAEAVIPIKRDARSYELLAQTMKLMGVGGAAGGGSTYAPVINVYADSMSDKRAIHSVVKAALADAARGGRSLSLGGY